MSTVPKEQFPCLPEELLSEQLRLLAPEVAALFYREGFVGAGASMILGLPIEQWYLELPDASTKSLHELANPTLCYYHQVKVKEKNADRIIGSAETQLRQGKLALVGVRTGPMDEHLEAVLKRLRALPLDPEDRSTLRILALANPHMKGLWRQWPDGRGEVWIAFAAETGPFYPLERITEADIPGTPGEGRKMNKGQSPSILRVEDARCELYGEPAFRVHLRNGGQKTGRVRDLFRSQVVRDREWSDLASEILGRKDFRAWRAAKEAERSAKEAERVTNRRTEYMQVLSSVQRLSYPVRVVAYQWWGDDGGYGLGVWAIGQGACDEAQAEKLVWSLTAPRGNDPPGWVYLPFGESYGPVLGDWQSFDELRLAIACDFAGRMRGESLSPGDPVWPCTPQQREQRLNESLHGWRQLWMGLACVAIAASDGKLVTLPPIPTAPGPGWELEFSGLWMRHWTPGGPMICSETNAAFDVVPLYLQWSRAPGAPIRARAEATWSAAWVKGGERIVFARS